MFSVAYLSCRHHFRPLQPTSLGGEGGGGSRNEPMPTSRTPGVWLNNEAKRNQKVGRVHAGWCVSLCAPAKKTLTEVFVPFRRAFASKTKPGP